MHAKVKHPLLPVPFPSLSFLTKKQKQFLVPLTWIQKLVINMLLLQKSTKIKKMLSIILFLFIYEMCQISFKNCIIYCFIKACVCYFLSNFYHQMIAFRKYEKCFLFHLKSSFRSWDIQVFVFSSPPLSHIFMKKSCRKCAPKASPRPLFNFAI